MPSSRPLRLEILRKIRGESGHRESGPENPGGGDIFPGENDSAFVSDPGNESDATLDVANGTERANCGRAVGTAAPAAPAAPGITCNQLAAAVAIPRHFCFSCVAINYDPSGEKAPGRGSPIISTRAARNDFNRKTRLL